jgi:predicted transposase/invertase (TIGR01784 family)
MSEINNVHDKFFKRTMADKKIARNMLENYLPEQILKLINLEDMELKKDSMIEKELKDIFSDLIYKVKLNGKKAYLYFLFEHKSYPYKKIALQLLKYMRNIWDLEMEQGKQGKLPLIIPLVFYHGRKKWNIGLSLSDILDDIPDELKNYIPEFKYLLYDFSLYSEQEITGRIELKIFLQALRYIFTDIELFKEEIKGLIELFEELTDKKTAVEYFETVIRYIMKAREGIDEKELIKIASEVSSERGEAIMTIAEKLRMEGIKEGINKGINKGKMEIAKNMLSAGMDIEQIIKLTNLDKEKIKLLKEEIKH